MKRREFSKLLTVTSSTTLVLLSESTAAASRLIKQVSFQASDSELLNTMAFVASGVPMGTNFSGME